MSRAHHTQTPTSDDDGRLPVPAERARGSPPLGTDPVSASDEWSSHDARHRFPDVPYATLPGAMVEPNGDAYEDDDDDGDGAALATAPASPTTGNPRGPREGRRRGQPYSPRQVGSQMGLEMSTSYNRGLRRTASAYTVMSNDGDGYAPYEPAADVRHAIAAEHERLAEQRRRLQAGLDQAEAPPLLPFPEAPTLVAPAPAGAASTNNVDASHVVAPLSPHEAPSIAADFLQPAFEQSYADALAGRQHPHAASASHHPAITPSATPQQRAFRMQVHVPSLSPAHDPGFVVTTPAPSPVALPRRSPAARPAAAPPPLHDTLSDIDADGSVRSGRPGSSAPPVPAAAAGHHMSEWQLQQYAVPPDDEDLEDQQMGDDAENSWARASKAGSGHQHHLPTSAAWARVRRAGSAYRSANDSTTGHSHNGKSLVSMKSAADLAAANQPCKPIERLPYDVLRLILIGFVDPMAQLQCRLVCTAFDATVTSACIMWYRRIPHHVFVAHLAHRLEHEVRVLGGRGDLQIYDAENMGMNWVAAHRALAETDAAAAAEEAAATAATDFRHRIPRPPGWRPAHAVVGSDDSEDEGNAREDLVSPPLQQQDVAGAGGTAPPSRSQTEQGGRTESASASVSDVPPGYPGGFTPRPNRSAADVDGGDDDHDAIVVGVGASPVYADEHHLRADIEGGPASEHARKQRQWTLLRRRQRLQHHHRELADGKFGNVPALDDPTFDAYGITFPGSSIELIRCHTFTLLLANQLRHYRSGIPDVSTETRDRWITQSCVGGCCHRQWAQHHEQLHREQHFEQQLTERLVLAGAISRALVFPATDHPAVVAGLLVVTFAALCVFATLAWIGPSVGIAASVQFAPLWAFFVLLYPVLYVFFGQSTIEPMVLCVLGFVGVTFSAVLVYFYRVVSPFKAMSWISCSTPMLLCTSCCATYSFLVMHRFSTEVTSWRLRLVAVAGCSLPALLLLFACTLALELDDTFVVRVGAVAGGGRGSADDSPATPPAATPPPPTHALAPSWTLATTTAAATTTPAPPPVVTTAPNGASDAENDDDRGDCDGLLRFSALVAAVACAALLWITHASLRIFKLGEIWTRFPGMAVVLATFAVAFGIGALTGVVAFVQGPLCIPTGVTFALAGVAVVALAAAFVGSAIATTQARELATGPPHRMPPDLVVPMDCASAILDAQSLYLRLCPTIEMNNPDSQMLNE